jgi:hypothetical protein
MARRESIEPSDPGTVTPDGLWHVWCDEQMTRRKSFHYISDPEGRVMFRSRLFGSVVEWLDGEGVQEYTLHVAGRSCHIDTGRLD